MRLKNSNIQRPFWRLIALVVAVTILFPPNLSASLAGSSATGIARRYEAIIPSEYGKVEEFHEGTSGKTLIYIQDAHDSLEAQEHIAALIRHTVENQQVKTVFEEGYEGPVPTDRYFGFIKDPLIREKVSYFLMDRLRLGGAEYAHINRTKEFRLVGVDNIRLHLQNIAWYQSSAEAKTQIESDLKRILQELETLSRKYFPRELRSWLGLKERFERDQLDLVRYLKETAKIWLEKNRREEGGGKREEKPEQIRLLEFEVSYPTISLLLRAEATKQKAILDELNAIDSKDLFEEMERLEGSLGERLLESEKAREIFRYLRTLHLLKRLMNIQVTQQEFAALHKTLQTFRTRELALFIAKETNQPVVFSKRWERSIESVVKFYETATARDQSLESHLDRFVKNPDEKTAILVFGGFHKSNIKKMLEEKGVSYLIVTPKITSFEKRQQDYYRMLMAGGHHPFEIPMYVRQAARAPVWFEEVEAGRITASALEGATRHLAFLAETYPNLPLDLALRKTNWGLALPARRRFSGGGQTPSRGNQKRTPVGSISSVSNRSEMRGLNQTVLDLSPEALSKTELELENISPSGPSLKIRFEVGLGADPVYLNENSLPIRLNLSVSGRATGSLTIIKHHLPQGTTLEIYSVDPFSRPGTYRYGRTKVMSTLLNWLVWESSRHGWFLRNHLTPNVRLLHLYRKYFADHILQLRSKAEKEENKDWSAMIRQFGFYGERIFGALGVIRYKGVGKEIGVARIRLQRTSDRPNQYEVMALDNIGEKLPFAEGSLVEVNGDGNIRLAGNGATKETKYWIGHAENALQVEGHPVLNSKVKTPRGRLIRSADLHDSRSEIRSTVDFWKDLAEIFSTIDSGTGKKSVPDAHWLERAFRTDAWWLNEFYAKLRTYHYSFLGKYGAHFLGDKFGFALRSPTPPIRTAAITLFNGFGSPEAVELLVDALKFKKESRPPMILRDKTELDDLADAISNRGFLAGDFRRKDILKPLGLESGWTYQTVREAVLKMYAAELAKSQQVGVGRAELRTASTPKPNASVSDLRAEADASDTSRNLGVEHSDLRGTNSAKPVLWPKASRPALEGLLAAAMIGSSILFFLAHSDWSFIVRNALGQVVAHLASSLIDKKFNTQRYLRAAAFGAVWAMIIPLYCNWIPTLWIAPVVGAQMDLFIFSQIGILGGFTALGEIYLPVKAGEKTLDRIWRTFKFQTQNVIYSKNGFLVKLVTFWTPISGLFYASIITAPVFFQVIVIAAMLFSLPQALESVLTDKNAEGEVRTHEKWANFFLKQWPWIPAALVLGLGFFNFVPLRSALFLGASTVVSHFTAVGLIAIKDRLMKRSELRTDLGKMPGQTSLAKTVFAVERPDGRGSKDRNRFWLFEVYDVTLNKETMALIEARSRQLNYLLYWVSEEQMRNQGKIKFPLQLFRESAPEERDAEIGIGAKMLLPESRSRLTAENFSENSSSSDPVRLSAVGVARITRQKEGRTEYLLGLNAGAMRRGIFRLTPLGGGIAGLTPEALQFLETLGVGTEDNDFDLVKAAILKAEDRQREKPLSPLQRQRVRAKAERDLRFRISGENLPKFLDWFLKRADRETDPNRELYEELVREYGILSEAEWAQFFNRSFRSELRMQDESYEKEAPVDVEALLREMRGAGDSGILDRLLQPFVKPSRGNFLIGIVLENERFRFNVDLKELDGVRIPVIEHLRELLSPWTAQTGFDLRRGILLTEIAALYAGRSRTRVSTARWLAAGAALRLWEIQNAEGPSSEGVRIANLNTLLLKDPPKRLPHKKADNYRPGGRAPDDENRSELRAGLNKILKMTDADLPRYVTALFYGLSAFAILSVSAAAVSVTSFGVAPTMDLMRSGGADFWLKVSMLAGCQVIGDFLGMRASDAPVHKTRLHIFRAATSFIAGIGLGLSCQAMISGIGHFVPQVGLWSWNNFNRAFLAYVLGAFWTALWYAWIIPMIFGRLAARANYSAAEAQPILQEYTPWKRLQRVLHAVLGRHPVWILNYIYMNFLTGTTQLVGLGCVIVAVNFYIAFTSSAVKAKFQNWAKALLLRMAIHAPMRFSLGWQLYSVGKTFSEIGTGATEKLLGQLNNQTWSFLSEPDENQIRLAIQKLQLLLPFAGSDKSIPGKGLDIDEFQEQMTNIQIILEDYPWSLRAHEALDLVRFEQQRFATLLQHIQHHFSGMPPELFRRLLAVSNTAQFIQAGSAQEMKLVGAQLVLKVLLNQPPPQNPQQKAPPVRSEMRAAGRTPVAAAVPRSWERGELRENGSERFREFRLSEKVPEGKTKNISREDSVLITGILRNGGYIDERGIPTEKFDPDLELNAMANGFGLDDIGDGTLPEMMGIPRRFSMLYVDIHVQLRERLRHRQLQAPEAPPPYPDTFGDIKTRGGKSMGIAGQIVWPVLVRSMEKEYYFLVALRHPFRGEVQTTQEGYRLQYEINISTHWNYQQHGMNHGDLLGNIDVVLDKNKRFVNVGRLGSFRTGTEEQYPWLRDFIRQKLTALKGEPITSANPRLFASFSKAIESGPEPIALQPGPFAAEGELTPLLDNLQGFDAPAVSRFDEAEVYELWKWLVGVGPADLLPSPVLLKKLWGYLGHKFKLRGHKDPRLKQWDKVLARRWFVFPDHVSLLTEYFNKYLGGIENVSPETLTEFMTAFLEQHQKNRGLKRQFNYVVDRAVDPDANLKQAVRNIERAKEFFATFGFKDGMDIVKAVIPGSDYFILVRRESWESPFGLEFLIGRTAESKNPFAGKFVKIGLDTDGDHTLRIINTQGVRRAEGQPDFIAEFTQTMGVKPTHLLYLLAVKLAERFGYDQIVGVTEEYLPHKPESLDLVPLYKQFGLNKDHPLGYARMTSDLETRWETKAKEEPQREETIKKTIQAFSSLIRVRSEVRSQELQADPAESVLGLPDSSDKRYAPRTFTLGTFQDRQGEKVTIHALEQIKSPHGWEEYTARFAYEKEGDKNFNLRNLTHSEYVLKAVRLDDTWEISEFYPYGDGETLIRRYAGTGATDLILEYLIGAVNPAGLDMRNSGMTDFAALRTYFRQRLEHRRMWPSRVEIEDSELFHGPVSLDEPRLWQVFFDARNLGDVEFRAQGRGPSEVQHLDLQPISGRPYQYRVTQVGSKQEPIHQGDEIKISFPGSVVTQNGKPVGRISGVQAMVYVSGFDRRSELRGSSPSFGEANTNRVLASRSLSALAPSWRKNSSATEASADRRVGPRMDPLPASPAGGRSEVRSVDSVFTEITDALFGGKDVQRAAQIFLSPGISSEGQNELLVKLEDDWDRHKPEIVPTAQGIGVKFAAVENDVKDPMIHYYIKVGLLGQFLKVVQESRSPSSAAGFEAKMLAHQQRFSDALGRAEEKTLRRHPGSESKNAAPSKSPLFEALLKNLQESLDRQKADPLWDWLHGEGPQRRDTIREVSLLVQLVEWFHDGEKEKVFQVIDLLIAKIGLEENGSLEIATPDSLDSEAILVRPKAFVVAEIISTLIPRILVAGENRFSPWLETREVAYGQHPWIKGVPPEVFKSALTAIRLEHAFQEPKYLEKTAALYELRDQSYRLRSEALSSEVETFVARRLNRKEQQAETSRWLLQLLKEDRAFSEAPRSELHQNASRFGTARVSASRPRSELRMTEGLNEEGAIAEPIVNPNPYVKMSVKGGGMRAWAKIFGNDHPLVVEIGSGNAKLLRAEAEKHPEWNFVGIDFRPLSKPSIRTLGLGPNARLVQGHGGQVLGQYFSNDSLEQILIIFPARKDVQPAPDTIKEPLGRLFISDFLKTYLKKLKPGGQLVVITNQPEVELQVWPAIKKIDGFDATFKKFDSRRRLSEITSVALDQSRSFQANELFSSHYYVIQAIKKNGFDKRNGALKTAAERSEVRPNASRSEMRDVAKEIRELLFDNTQPDLIKAAGLLQGKEETEKQEILEAFGQWFEQEIRSSIKKNETQWATKHITDLDYAMNKHLALEKVTTYDSFLEGIVGDSWLIKEAVEALRDRGQELREMIFDLPETEEEKTSTEAWVEWVAEAEQTGASLYDPDEEIRGNVAFLEDQTDYPQVIAGAIREQKIQPLLDWLLKIQDLENWEDEKSYWINPEVSELFHAILFDLDRKNRNADAVKLVDLLVAQVSPGDVLENRGQAPVAADLYARPSAKRVTDILWGFLDSDSQPFGRTGEMVLGAQDQMQLFRKRQKQYRGWIRNLPSEKFYSLAEAVITEEELGEWFSKLHANPGKPSTDTDSLDDEEFSLARSQIYRRPWVSWERFFMLRVEAHLKAKEDDVFKMVEAEFKEAVLDESLKREVLRQLPKLLWRDATLFRSEARAAGRMPDAATVPPSWERGELPEQSRLPRNTPLDKTNFEFAQPVILAIEEAKLNAMNKEEWEELLAMKAINPKKLHILVLNASGTSEAAKRTEELKHFGQRVYFEDQLANLPRGGMMIFMGDMKEGASAWQRLDRRVAARIGEHRFGIYQGAVATALLLYAAKDGQGEGLGLRRQNGYWFDPENHYATRLVSELVRNYEIVSQAA